MLNNNFKDANELIADQVKQELRDQGHYLTGALEASFKEEEIVEAGNIILRATAVGYLDQLEHGVPADRIQLTEGYFQNLKKWVRQRGMGSSEFEVSQIAAAIFTKWKKEGMPTENSKAFSKTGKRIEAVRDAFHDNETAINSAVDKAVFFGLDTEFSNIKSGVI
jgi:hypothetical protein